MQDNISTNTESGPTTGPATGPEVDNSVKTRLANMLLNRVSLSECLNVIREACVKRADDIFDKADEKTLKDIVAELEIFENPPKNEGVPEESADSELQPVEVAPASEN